MAIFILYHLTFLDIKVQIVSFCVPHEVDSMQIISRGVNI